MYSAVFVKNLHPEVTETMLKERFSPAGHVHSVRICRDRLSGLSLGNAYVNFRSSMDGKANQTENCSLHCFCSLIPVYSPLKCVIYVVLYLLYWSITWICSNSVFFKVYILNKVYILYDV